MSRPAILAAGLAAGLALAAGPAPAAMASPPPFSLSVSPARLPAGPPGSVRTLTVTSNGTKPVTVRAELSELARGRGGRCAVGPLGTVQWAAVRPATFTLPPGAHRAATLTIARHVPAGPHDLITAFVAAPAENGGGVTVSGAVGAQMQVQSAGHPTGHPCLTLTTPRRTVAADPAPAHPFPWTLAVIAALLAAVIALTTLVLRQRRRIHVRQPPTAP